jgi:predicted ribosome quality control (RQC) complex YloA/Tae2 family protein
LSLNWKEINLVLEELALEGAHIQGIRQSAYDILAFQIYGPAAPGGAGSRLILVSLSPLACRIHETFRAAPKSGKPLRFAELLKSRILNSRIEEAIQLGDNRIIRLGLRRGESRFRLYIRLWSNAANVILTDEEGRILDAMKRLPKRGEISGGVYCPEEEFSQTGKAAGTAGEGANLPGGPAFSGRQGREYALRELPGEGSFNSRVDRWYAEHGGKLSLGELREEVRRNVGGNRERLEAALRRLREKEKDYAGAERFREYGDLILACLPPEGSSWLESDSLHIELDPGKNFVKNAEAYYGKYRRAKSGLGEIREEIAAGEKELLALDEMERRLLEENNPLRLEGLLKKIRGKIPQEGSGPGKRRRPEKKIPRGLTFADGDWLILVGRNARENDDLLRRHVRGNDLWLHVRDRAGSYVFIRNRPGKTVPLEILLDAGNLALFYSGGRNEGRGDLYYTQVKYLRRARGGARGLVIPTQEKNLSITLDKGRLKRLETARIQNAGKDG